MLVAKIYDIMEDYELNFDLYQFGVINAIRNYLNQRSVKYVDSLFSIDPFSTRGIYTLVLIDKNGDQQMVQFEYDV